MKRVWWRRPSTWLALVAGILLLGSGYALWQQQTAAAATPAPANRSEVVNDFVALALERSAAGDIQGAMEALDIAIAAAPDAAPQAYYYRALLHLELGEDEAALEDLNKAIEQNPHFPEAFAARGNVHLSLGRPVSAVEDFNKALQFGLADEASVYINRGLAYFQMDIYDLAEQDFQKALELNPESEAAWFNLGSLYLKQGRDEEALEAFNKVVELNPDMAAVYFNRAIAWANLGKIDEAIADLEKYLTFPITHNAQLQAEALLERLRSGKGVELDATEGEAAGSDAATPSP
ncbi:MAG: tetratricopeptide repeat protein [Chloroflexi bacterium]|nr:tetratricopeptide repeat protein [Chloroflexota bacterium]